MPGIWLDDDTYRQTAGDLWAHGITQRLSAGQAWAQQAMQTAMQQTQQAVAPIMPQAPAAAAAPPPPPTIPTPAPTPAPEPVTPAPTPMLGVGQTPTAEPAAGSNPAPTPGPAPAPESTPPAPTPTAIPDIAKAGQDWAQQTLQNLLNPAPAAPQTPSSVPDLSPAPGGLNASAAIPSTTATGISAPTPDLTSTPAPAPSAAPSTVSTPTNLGPIDSSSQQAFAASIAPYAQAAAQKLGIDPKWVASMAASESNYGKAPGNELFGIKALPGQPGTSLQTHEGEYGGTTMNQTFASYDTPMDAVNAFVNLIQNHYPGAVGAQTLGDFVHGLKQGGYFTAAEPEYKGILDSIQGRIGGAVDAALSGASQVGSSAQSAVSQGQTAVNTAVQGVQAAVARTSQFAMGLSSGDAMAFCGPAAAMAFAQTYGRNPTVEEAKQLAQQVGWSQAGMAGPASEVSLLNKLGIDAHMTNGVDWSAVAQSASSGNPVILNAPDHYYYVDGYDPQTNRFHLGSSATDLKANTAKQEWFTSDQIPGLGQGTPNAAIFADHPLTQGSPTPPGSGGGQQGSLTMGPLSVAVPQPGESPYPMPGRPGGLVTPPGTYNPPAGSLALAALGPDLSSQALLDRGHQLSQQLLAQSIQPSDVQNKAQDVMSAVTNVGGPVVQALNQSGQNLLGGAQDLLGTTPQSVSNLLNQNALISQGVPAVQNAAGNLPGVLAGLAPQLGPQIGQLLYGSSGQPLTQAQANQIDLTGLNGGGVTLPTDPLQLLGGMSPYGVGTAGEQLTNERNAAIAQANPLRDVPLLGGLTTLGTQAVLDPTNLLLGVGPNLGRATLPAAADLVSSDAVRQFLTESLGSAGMPQDIAALRAAQAAPGAAASPSGITLGDWLKGGFRGGIISSPATMLDVATNSGIMPLISHITGGTRDLLGAVPDVLTGQGLGPTAGRVQGRAIGAAMGVMDLADRSLTDNPFLSQLTPTTRLAENAQSLIGRAQPGLERVAAYGAEGAGALHGAFSQAARNLVTSEELGAMGGELGAKQGLSGQDLRDFVQNFIQNPPAEARAAADAVGARASSTQQLGPLASALGQGVSKLPEPLQSALFPVYRKGMQMASRMVELSPLGTASTGFDVARGLLGKGPYAALQDQGLRNAFNITPEGNAYGPLGERLANNALGTALSIWLASKADIHQPDGPTITGSWNGLTSAQQDVLRGQGQMPNAVKFPDGTWHDWSKVPPALKGPLMAAGAYADSQYAYDKALAAQQSAGPQAYGLEDPHAAQALALVNEVGTQLANSSPLRTWSNTYDMLTGGGTQKGLQQLVDIPSSVLGGLVPESAITRTAAQATDPLERQTLRPKTLSEVLPAILQNVQQNIPGVRETGVPGVMAGLPARVDVAGRDVVNPLQGLGAILPMHAAAGQSSPVLAAMANVGVAPSAPPPSIPYGPTAQINLSPEDQRQWERYRGQLLQQMSQQLVSSPNYAQMSPDTQKIALTRVSQIAGEAAGKMLLGDLAPQAPSRMSLTGVLAPVQPYGANPLDQLQLMRSHAAHQALIQALLTQ